MKIHAISGTMEATSVDDDLFDTSNAIVAAVGTPSRGEGATSQQEDMMESTSRIETNQPTFGLAST
jgi:hypothetical protein